MTVEPKTKKRLMTRDIITDSRIQPRCRLNKSTVEDYAEMMQRGVKFPPLVVFTDGESQQYWLVEGFHRVAAYLAIRQEQVACEIVIGDMKSARLHAAMSNTEHGLPRSNADKRRVVKRMLELAPRRGDRSIALQLNVSHPFVAKMRRQKFEAADMVSGNVTTDATTGYAPRESTETGNRAARKSARKPMDEPRVFDVSIESDRIEAMVMSVAEKCESSAEWQSLARALDRMARRVEEMGAAGGDSA